MEINIYKITNHDFSFFLHFSTPNSAGPYGPIQGNVISSPTNAMHDGNFRPPPPSMKVADNHKGSLMFTPPQQYSQPQVQQPLSPVNMQRYQQNGPNMNTPVRSHHHPPAIHQMYSSNGNAYTYNGNRKQMSPNDPQVHSPNGH